MNGEHNDKQQQKNQAKAGLDSWNERLDHNLEPENTGNEAADISAEDFSKAKGSGDQSDNPDINPADRPKHYNEDNMAKNHPHASDLKDDLKREE